MDDFDRLRRAYADKRPIQQGKYDCIIGASGGLDTSYVIYVAKTVLNLNPLVVTYDAGLSYEHARRNLATLCRVLGVELRVLRSPGRHDLKYVRSMLLALRSLDAYWGVCAFCHYVLKAAVYSTARAENIPMLLTSRNVYEADLHLSPSFRKRYMLRAFRTLPMTRLPSFGFYLMAGLYHLARLKLEYFVPPAGNLFRRCPAYKIAQLNITKYIPWHIDSIVQTLEEHAGWKLPDHPNLRMRFDCQLEDGFVNHTYKTATGMTIHGIIASNLVRGGVEDRHRLEEAVRYYDMHIEEARASVLRCLETALHDPSLTSKMR